ncbi:unnamed protein product [Protopolystoma xenopodis]|uniref:tRNA-guanine(15) transglycosylase-like domain-containing protein n=1 Tax=Protopolystoma xenopodis TaxID=117903 RepID=A0A3S5BPQ7_9PLAT|nr:unnamed protein product [Protopolystoma xenopodis]
MVAQSCRMLPKDRPRYLMGVGFPVDIVVCVALGVDMFDCVYPTRTGRFGQALVPWGQVSLRLAAYAKDFLPIDSDCQCPACSRCIPRAWFHAALGGRQTNAVSLISLHNLTYMLGLMRQLREAISSGQLPDVIRRFFSARCRPSAISSMDPSSIEMNQEPEGCGKSDESAKVSESKKEFDFDGPPPRWAVEALASVGVDISDIGSPNPNSASKDSALAGNSPYLSHIKNSIEEKENDSNYSN